MLEIIAILIFIGGYTAIALEHFLGVNKSAVALSVGALLWMVAAIAVPDFAHVLSESTVDIFSIVVFLLAAMSLVEILVHYELFDVLRGKMLGMGLDDKKQFVFITLMTFMLSAVIDNLTATIVMIQISRRFFKGENMLIAAAGIVISANAGGAFSPIGDVTTIMLWFAEKFNVAEIVSKGILPSIALWGVSTAMLSRRIKPGGADSTTEVVNHLARSEKLIIGTVLISFLLPLGMSQLGLPPYLGLLLGLGIVWLVIDIFKKYVPRRTHLNASIEELIKKVDVASLKFFIGILSAVSALHSIGVLERVAHYVYGELPTTLHIIWGNILLGAMSAILDNVPLTAIAINILHVDSPSLWVLLALAVGTGGSMLIIGSAAGVVAMGMVHELTFAKYLKIGFWAALAGFVTAMGVWALQYFVFGF